MLQARAYEECYYYIHYEMPDGTIKKVLEIGNEMVQYRLQNLKLAYLKVTEIVKRRET